MRFGLRASVAVLVCVSASAQTVDVGSGAPTPAIQELFVEAWARNAFNLQVALPPLGNVRKFGTTGYVQEFSQALQSTSAKLAIVYNPNLNAAFQELAAMYTFYNATSPATAGYPIIDTTNCPALITSQDSNNSCQYQFFDSNYALFTYSALLLLSSQTFSIADPYYTKWLSFGGVAGNNGFALGPPLTAQTAVTSSFSSKATLQTYDRGAIYNVTSGTLTGRLLAVKEPIYDLYIVNGLHGGLLGLPATEELVLPNGMREQMFEGGAIEYDPVTLIPVLLSPVGSVTIQPSSSAQLNLGDAVTVTATVTSILGVTLSNRAVIWNTSNGNVAQVSSASGLTATIKGVGGGVAKITATSGGKTSAPLSVTVIAPCCQIGEGAPAALQTAFQAAVSRDKLNVALPAAAAALRVGNGYIQQFQSTDAPPVSYLIAVPDGAGTGYVVTGAILAAYQNLGGPLGVLGYPTADATPGGRQIFQNGVLAGLPVQLVNGGILTKWAAIGYEGGVAGSPSGAATSFSTFRATSGLVQSFQNAIITQTGGSAFAVTSLILAKYLASGAASGSLGAPVSDEYTVAPPAHRRQDFEGGYADYASGDTSANVVIAARTPVVTATPSSVLAGSFVHLTIGGFDNNSAVRVSITGQPDFLTTLAAGAYAWDVFVPAGASNGIIVVRAAYTVGTVSAQASYTVRAPSSVAMTLAILSGDGQSGAPGAVLTTPLTVVLKDNLGNPVPGQSVTFTASPGAQLISSSTLTDALGQASAVLRLPSSESLALVTAQAAHQVVTFSARAAAFSLTNFPALSQAVAGNLGNGADTIRAKGSLLTAVASIILYHQARGELASPHGLADPVTLNAFLQSADGFVSLNASADQTVNLWRVAAFVAGNIDVSIEPPDLNTLRALVGAGSPVLLALSISGNVSGNNGSHFVVATGIVADGSLLISDPDPSFGQTNLNGYLAGLATLVGAVRLLPRAPASSSAFLLISDAPMQLSSLAGTCGTTLAFPASAAVAGITPSAGSGTLYFRPCSGAASVYELDGTGMGFLDDLSTANTHVALPAGSAEQQIAGSAGSRTISPLQTAILSGGIVNAASLTPDIAPGGIVSIFGSGLALSTVQVNGEPASLLAALPFQINAQIPFDIPAGTATVTVISGSGSATAQAAISQVAPGIFMISTGQAAITNQDNSLNTGSNPAVRGASIVIYGTGFGAVGSSGGLSPVKTALSVVIGGSQLAPSFAGLTPGAIGLYQANVALPVAMAPGLMLPLYLKQGTAISNSVTVAVQ